MTNCVFSNKVTQGRSFLVICILSLLAGEGVLALIPRVSRPPSPPKASLSPDAYMPTSLLPPVQNLAASSTRRLSRLEVQQAINYVKRFVEHRLESDLNLVKHTAPLAFLSGTGVNDELDGSESKSAVHFTVPNRAVPRGVVVAPVSSERSPYEIECEVVQSLAKWKRLMLRRLEVPIGQGIYCDSTSIRKGYKGDVTHSVVADQWDFEIRVAPEQRTIEQLQLYVSTLWKIIIDTEESVLTEFPGILLPGHPTSQWRLPKELHFVTSDQLHELFPDMGVHDRETAAVRKWGAIFVCGMGWPMADGSPPEEVRSPDYDDWMLNGDILVLHPLTEYRHELCSLGIRVDGPALLRQLEHRGRSNDASLPYHRAVLEEKVPLSFGGGLGISRLLMLLLRTAHIGEVHVGVWHDAHYRQAWKAGIDLIPDRIVDGGDFL